METNFEFEDWALKSYWTGESMDDLEVCEALWRMIKPYYRAHRNQIDAGTFLGLRRGYDRYVIDYTTYDVMKRCNFDLSKLTEDMLHDAVQSYERFRLFAQSELNFGERLDVREA